MDDKKEKEPVKYKRHWTSEERQALINLRIKEKEVRKGYLQRIKELYK